MRKSTGTKTGHKMLVKWTPGHCFRALSCPQFSKQFMKRLTSSSSKLGHHLSIGKKTNAFKDVRMKDVGNCAGGDVTPSVFNYCY